MSWIVGYAKTPLAFMLSMHWCRNCTLSKVWMRLVFDTTCRAEEIRLLQKNLQNMSTIGQYLFRIDGFANASVEFETDSLCDSLRCMAVIPDAVKLLAQWLPKKSMMSCLFKGEVPTSAHNWTIEDFAVGRILTRLNAVCDIKQSGPALDFLMQSLLKLVQLSGIVVERVAVCQIQALHFFANSASSSTHSAGSTVVNTLSSLLLKTSKDTGMKYTF